ncbi:MAG: glycosyltransferase, partial [Ruminococcus sp.]|nr:glycosyltransferase [Candidatus Copronaster equi]
MKIGFLISDLSAGGAERTTVSLANYFAEHGNIVEIITLSDCEPFYKVNENVSVVSVNLTEIEHKASFGRLKGSIDRMFKIRKFIKSRKLNVLIGMSFSMTRYAVFATAFTKTKVIGTERNNPYVYKASKLNTILRRIFYRLTNGFVFQTKKSAEFFTYNFRKNEIVIQNAIFNQEIYNFIPPETRQKYICSVGRLCKQKRFDLLIKAFSMLEPKFPDYKLIIFGDGPDKEKLNNRIKFYNLQDKIFLLGNSQDIIGYLNEVSVFVLCSDYEGMPNALMEAMALGVPCVSTKCDMGPEELITDGING